MRYLIVVMIACLGCGAQEAPAPEPEPEAAPAAASAKEADDAAIEAARAAAKQLGGTLKARVSEAMGSGGPKAAIAVCADEAQALTATVAADTGARVGRSSLRLRNPKNEGPGWVTSWLQEQGERKAEGVQGFARVEDLPEWPVARFVAPIAVEAVCVTCHGAPETLPPDVKEVLASRYPTDQATGYAEGDLRGAVWAEVPVRAASAAP